MKRKYDGELIFAGKDAYGVVEVVDGPILRTLHFGNSIIQSSMYLNDPVALEMEYNRVMMMALLFNPEPHRALFLGLGGGAKQKFLCHFFPSCHVDVVEISPLVIEIYHRFFRGPDDIQIIIYQEDALNFLKESEEKEYDFIFVDVYVSMGMDESVANRTFFELCQRKLKKEGILIWNLWQSTQPIIMKNSILHLENSFQENYLILPNDESPNFVVLVFNSPAKTFTLDETRHNAKLLYEKTGVDFPKVLEHLLPHFKEHCPLFQHWTT
jgi:spermidine synthase